MILPRDYDYKYKESLVDRNTQIHGNHTVAEEIRKLAKEYSATKDLYITQDLIKDYVTIKYGIDFYMKSGEAINYIVENEYCHMERERLPLFDMKRYIYDIYMI